MFKKYARRNNENEPVPNEGSTLQHRFLIDTDPDPACHTCSVVITLLSPGTWQE